MAVGLEVRVPFCDHRLVEYVFNIPWRMKTFDNREKSVLRAAASPLLPDSIVKRVKNPYPSTQDPAYERALRAQVAAIAGDRSHVAAPLFDAGKVRQALAREPGNVSTLADRTNLERVRSMSTWFEEYKPALAA
jgi:asparagine synthase (glutamine-hydrolysing)